MSLPNYLQKIKSSGIYRFVWDKSEIPGPEAEILRLVVGYSEKGPFNTPVYIQNETEFRTIYGGISKKLERYGMWFHRMAIQALKRGPILALNLKTFNTNPDKPEVVDAITFNPNEEMLMVNDEGGLINKIKLVVEDIYNTNRFWSLEPEHFEDIESINKYITISATDSIETSNTIFVRGYNPAGYDISFKEWFSSVLNGEEVPSYLQDFELQKLSQYWAEVYVFKGKFTPEIATSDKLAKFFDVDGDEVALKPYVLNAFGEKIDTLEALAQNSASNFIQSYVGILLPEFQSANGSVISLDMLFNSDYQKHKMIMRLNQSMLYNEDITVDQLDTTGWTKGFDYNKGLFSIKSIKPNVSKAEYKDGQWKYSGVEGGVNYYNYKIDIDNVEDYKAILKCEDSKPELLGLEEGDKFLAIHKEEVEGEEVIVNEIATLVKYEEVKTGDTITSVELTFDKPAVNIVNIDLTLSEEYDNFWTEKDDNLIQSEYATYVYDQLIKCVSSVTAGFNSLLPLYVQGYEYTNKKPRSTKQNDKLIWQESIMDALIEYRGVRLALTNNTDSQWRYLVDTFEGFVEAECHSKLAIICKEKFNCLGLLNFPAMRSFSNCEYTSFKDANNRFQIEYIPKGGNRQRNVTRPFSLVSEENGASFVSYNTPVIIQDSITGVKTTVPSAALVSNLYLDKFDYRYPYSIVAGPNYGRVIETGLIGPDFNFSRADLDILEPMGVNAMVYVPLKGTYINSNQTAKQNPTTTLSKINVRELVTFIQDEVEKLLQNYQWEFNTQVLRNTIKDRVDVILDRIKNNGGLYEYNSVCSEFNNTDDVINNEMLVVDLSIEPGIGAGKMVQSLTLYRKGGLSSTVVE